MPQFRLQKLVSCYSDIKRSSLNNRNSEITDPAVKLLCEKPVTLSPSVKSRSSRTILEEKAHGTREGSVSI